MTPDAEWVDIDLTVIEAANRMADGDIGAMPICDGEGHLQGMVTDRDIVVKVIAAGMDPNSTSVGEVFGGAEVVTIGADDTVEEALRTMKEHAVRRLPVIDGKKLVGMVAQADIALSLGDKQVGDLVDTISAAPPNN